MQLQERKTKANGTNLKRPLLRASSAHRTRVQMNFVFIRFVIISVLPKDFPSLYMTGYATDLSHTCDFFHSWSRFEGTGTSNPVVGVDRKQKKPRTVYLSSPSRTLENVRLSFRSTPMAETLQPCRRGGPKRIRSNYKRVTVDSSRRIFIF